jgi:hypothetical protein
MVQTNMAWVKLFERYGEGIFPLLQDAHKEDSWIRNSKLGFIKFAQNATGRINGTDPCTGYCRMNDDRRTF